MKLAHILVCHTTDPTQAVESIPHQEGALWYVFLHSQDDAIEQRVMRLMAPRDGNVFAYKCNRGLARSWNEGLHLAMEAGCDAVLLLNDDLFFYEEGYRAFSHTIEVISNISHQTSFVTVNGLESGGGPLSGKVIQQSFACCAIMRSCIEKVGYFDQNFAPAYYEDFDYNLRAGGLGFHSHLDQRTLVEHQRSSTASGMNSADRAALDESFEANKRYFIKKWGSEVGVYHRPFNSSKFGHSIDFSDRFDPYPGE